MRDENRSVPRTWRNFFGLLGRPRRGTDDASDASVHAFASDSGSGRRDHGDADGGSDGGGGDGGGGDGGGGD